MNIRTPRSGDHARIIKKFFAESGINVSHSDALNLTARLHGYKDSQAMLKDPAYQDALALTAVSSNEFDLVGPKQSTVWINVDNISVYIKKDDEGVAVDLFQKGHENDESLASTWALYADAAEACKRCGSPLDSSGYCEDLTCPHSDWPQSVDVDNLGDMAETEVEAHFKVHKSKGFTVTEVDWMKPAEQDTVRFVRLNKDLFELTRFENKNLKELAQCTNMGVRLRLSQLPGFAYRDKEGKEVEWPLGRLFKAVEYAPGSLDLTCSVVLQLLSLDNEGFKVFSPALNRFVIDTETLPGFNKFKEGFSSK